MIVLFVLLSEPTATHLLKMTLLLATKSLTLLIKLKALVALVNDVDKSELVL